MLLARGPRYRLSAEMIRDNALASSGLLVHKVGGPSVKPYQPPGLWIEKGNFSAALLNYKQDEGEDLYRRSLYTFIRRTSPPSSSTRPRVSMSRMSRAPGFLLASSPPGRPRRDASAACPVPLPRGRP